MNRNRLMGVLVLVLSMLGGMLHAQQLDEIYNQKTIEYTTDERFLPNEVLGLLKDTGVPSPLDHFGEIIGTPKIMHNTEKIYGYYRIMAEKSPRMDMVQVGTSEEGRPMYLMVIADEETMGNLEYYKQQLAELADPRKIDAAKAAKIIKTAKPIYFLNGGLHSPETGSPHMLMELAYRLVTDTSANIRKIRERVIVIVNPVSEPDGWDKMTDWYYRYSIHRTDYEDGMPARPPYWGKYTVHDNNRDGLQITQELTKAAYRIYFEWYPTVMLDLHESVPLLYLSSGTGPYNDEIDPITVSEWNLFSQYELTQLTASGLPGVFTWGFYDGWYPGYLFWIANNHNSVGRFYETFGNAGSNTFLRDISRSRYAGKAATSREWYRPDPATGKVLWSFRNNINYMQAGVLASLRYVADNGENLLENFYKKGARAIEKGLHEAPRAYLIPAEQHDPTMAAYLVNQLRAQGIEVHLVSSGKQEGAYVVKLDQPYGNLARTLLNVQKFPKDAEYPPYDDIAWTFGLLYGVKVEPQEHLPADLGTLALLTHDAVYEGKISGSGRRYVLPYRAQNTVLSALYWLGANHQSAVCNVVDSPFRLKQVADSLPAGSLVIEGLTASVAKDFATKYGLDLLATDEEIVMDKRKVTLPRVAVYHSWAYTQDEGWTRFTLEQRGIPYTSIDKDDLKEGKLNDRFDVILIPRLRGGASDFIHEIDSKFSPMPYTKTAEFPSHGYPDETTDMTGGPGFQGVANLSDFLKAGGVVVTMDNSSMMLAEAGVIPGLGQKQVSSLLHPGSVVRVRGRASNNPVLYGYPELFHVFRGNGPVLQVDRKDRDQLLLQYGAQTAEADKEYTGPIMGKPEADTTQISKPSPDYSKSDYPYVLSGMVRNEETILGEGAVFSVPVGKGHAVAFSFDPLHRYQNHHDAPLVWNVLINWNHLK